MQRGFVVAGVAVATGAGLWAALPAASAGGDREDGNREDGNRDGEVFRVVSREVDSAELDLGEPGFGIGDRFVFTDNLFKRGKLVGSDHGECVVTRIQGEGGTFHCVVTAIFHGKGQITGQGAASFTADPSAPFTVAVTGGTGRFRDAGGEVVVDDSAADFTVLTFKLDD